MTPREAMNRLRREEEEKEGRTSWCRTIEGISGLVRYTRSAAGLAGNIHLDGRLRQWTRALARVTLWLSCTIFRG
jgi:hypothetical protein